MNDSALSPDYVYVLVFAKLAIAAGERYSFNQGRSNNHSIPRIFVVFGQGIEFIGMLGCKWKSTDSKVSDGAA